MLWPGRFLNAITTVQAFTREPHEQQRFNIAVETAFVEAKKRITMRSVLTAMAIVMSFGVIVFVLWIGAQQVTAGVMTLGELTQFVLYAVLIAGSIGALSETWGDLQRAAGAMERLVELMQAPPDLVYGNTAAGQAPILLPWTSSSPEQQIRPMRWYSRMCHLLTHPAPILWPSITCRLLCLKALGMR